MIISVDLAHEGSRGGQLSVDEDKYCFLSMHFYSLADHVDELSEREIIGNEELVFIDGWCRGFGGPVHQDTDPAWILRSHTMAFVDPIFERDSSEGAVEFSHCMCIRKWL